MTAPTLPAVPTPEQVYAVLNLDPDWMRSVVIHGEVDDYGDWGFSTWHRRSGTSYSGVVVHAPMHPHHTDELAKAARIINAAAAGDQ